MNIQGPLTKLSFLQILKSTRSNFNFIVLLYCFFIHIFHCLSFQWFDLIWLKRLGGWGGCAITRVPSRQVANSGGDEGWSLVVDGIKIKAISQQKYKQGTDTERPMASFPLFHQKDCHHLFGTLFTI